MAVPNATSTVSYTGNDSTSTPYVVPFPFLLPEHLVVVVVDADGASQTLDLGDDYVVSGAGEEDGGGLTTLAAWDATYELIIRREVPATQLSRIEEGGKFPASTIERALDLQVMLIQQALRQTGAALRVLQQNGTALDPLVRRDTTVIGFDGDAQPRTYTPDELAEFLNLTAQMFDRPMATFADDGARAVAVPDFLGQLGVQRDDGTLWIATGTDAGDWTEFQASVSAEEILTTLGLDDGDVGDVVTRTGAGTTDIAFQAPQAFTGNKSLNGGVSDLRARRTGTFTAAVSVAEIVFSAGDISVRFTGPPEAEVDLNETGIGGLDTGTLLSNTWYHLWLVSDGSQFAAVASLSQSSPTLPSGWDNKARVGAIRYRTSGAGGILPFLQMGSRVWTEHQIVFTDISGVVSFTSLDISAFVPSTAIVARGVVGSSSGSTTGVNWVNIASDVDGAFIDYGGVSRDNNASQNGPWRLRSDWEVPLVTPQTIYWQSRTVNPDRYRLTVTGYDFGSQGGGGGSESGSNADYVPISTGGGAGGHPLDKPSSNVNFTTYDVAIHFSQTDRTLSLTHDDASKGDRAAVILNFTQFNDATATINIRDLNSSGTILYQIGGDGTDFRVTPTFVYTGTEWIPAGIK